ncbi:cytochrome c biogenesis protein DipZ [Demequina sp. SYSU T00039]|uniref:Cytochrome c biogenesis protein DipZ n=1 Tax=Demequina lignilytica TaxID=3051663 RepID=A0AAW7M8T1_9MICO|nr:MULTISPECIES: cytochrome c biogenesis protein DipZ [unclassified Demequina]MDN4477259.1 cytochrome c biogenesis protein DipZ [Demequina sp. SYSU T00039-1]MDN4487432.1 cytochrome c biogenesis protein DipZ [Demequina sp. SYSU T00039]MDN4491185.1 cytochrome c biogenesis protein DipZ [Demequina sp. SYSU T00068]
MAGMFTLVLVGLISGVITAISPCVLPVLPAILTSSIQDGAASRRRPLVVVAGLVLSFAVFTLLGGILLSSLGLPDDLLRWTGIVVLAVVGLGLMIPRLGELIQRPFERIRPLQADRNGNGFVMGLGLGLVFVPCAGPILASITVLAATNGVSWGLVALTLAFSAGIAIPLLVFGLAGQSIFGRIKAVRERLQLIRSISGAVLIATALVIATNVAEPLQRIVPGWLAGIQTTIEDNDAVRSELDTLAGREAVDTSVTGDALGFDACEDDPSVLQNCGPARDLVGIQDWLNTDGEALDLDELAQEGEVVLIDFWTYSCINCQRTFPYLTAWDEKYRDAGLTIIGVHSPEFAFEKVVDNVADATDRYGIEYPVAIDNDFETWREWDQRFWPAHYLIDSTGTVRQVHYGEGAYEQTELLIQQLLETTPQMVEANPDAHTSDRTAETYVGYARGLGANANGDFPRDEPHDFGASFTPGPGQVALGGTWTVTSEYAEAGDDATLDMQFYAGSANLVLGGEGTVTVTLKGDPGYRKVIDVSGAPDLQVLWEGEPGIDVLHLEVSPGVEAYAFTFG